MKHIWLLLGAIVMLDACENARGISEKLAQQEQQIRSLPDSTGYDVIIGQVRALSDSIARLMQTHADDSLAAMRIRVANWENELHREKKAYWEMQSCFRSAFSDSIDARNCMQKLHQRLDQMPNALKRSQFQEYYDASATAYIILFCEKRPFYSLQQINSAIHYCSNLSSSISSVFKKQQTNRPLSSLYEKRKELFIQEFDDVSTEFEITMIDSIRQSFHVGYPDFELVGITEDNTENATEGAIHLPAIITRNYNVIATKTNFFFSKQIQYPVKVTGEITGSESTGLSSVIKQVVAGTVTEIE